MASPLCLRSLVFATRLRSSPLSVGLGVLPSDGLSVIFSGGYYGASATPTKKCIEPATDFLLELRRIQSPCSSESVSDGSGANLILPQLGRRSIHAHLDALAIVSRVVFSRPFFFLAPPGLKLARRRVCVG